MASPAVRPATELNIRLAPGSHNHQPPLTVRPYRPLALLVAAGAALALVPLRGATEAEPDARAVENLAAFARVYGYVRFFDPSDQAAEVDWNRVAVLGAEAVRGAPDAAALRAALLEVLQPTAPRMTLTDGQASAVDAPRPTGAARLIFWQYRGVKLGNEPSPYQQRRVMTGEANGPHAPLFAPAEPPPPWVKTIAPGLVLRLPLALPVDAEGKTVPADPAGFAALQARLAAIDWETLTDADWRVRVADVIIVWNVFQHFHPYLDLIGVNWDAALAPALRRALRDPTGEDLRATLLELVAKSHDGHGYVYARARPLGSLPIRVAVVAGRIVVTGVGSGSPLQRGDIVGRLDGVPALDVLRDRERYASGSPQLSEFRALNGFGEGDADAIARVEITRDGAALSFELKRVRALFHPYFFNPVGEFPFPPFAEVKPGIFYVNLYALGADELAEKLPQLAGARGVIFDWRFGSYRPNEKVKPIQPHSDILPHLIDHAIQASPMLIPRISQPDRVGWSYDESTWPVEPRAPRFQGRVVFINEPSVVSYGETCMAMIADYHLATLVGAPTAGCNGNANFVPLPGGFRVMWTGMDVRKHDQSPFYNVGFPPDVPVARTLEAAKAGRDEYLEAAIAVIEDGKN